MDIGHWYFISKQKWDLIKDGDNLSNKQMFERHSLVTTRSENAFAINDMQYAGTDKFFCIHNNLKSFCRFFLIQNQISDSMVGILFCCIHLMTGDLKCILIHIFILQLLIKAKESKDNQ